MESKENIKTVELPMRVIDAYCDMNALTAYCFRELDALGDLPRHLPGVDGKEAEEIGISLDGGAWIIAGILWRYFQEQKQKHNKA